MNVLDSQWKRWRRVPATSARRTDGERLQRRSPVRDTGATDIHVQTGPRNRSANLIELKRFRRQRRHPARNRVSRRVESSEGAALGRGTATVVDANGVAVNCSCCQVVKVDA